MTTISDLFYIEKGKSYFKDFTENKNSHYNYITTSEKNQGVKCRVEENNNYKLYPSGIITVAMQGSVLSSFVQTRPFYLQTHVAALIPKDEMSINEKIYYTLAINAHANKYNYGRKANSTLGSLKIPSKDEIPSWVYEMEIPTFDDIKDSKTEEEVVLPPVNEWKSFTYNDIFNISKAKGIKIAEAKQEIGNVPYVSASSENNGIVWYGNFIAEEKGGCLTVGHLGDVFYQSNDFSGSNVTVLRLKNNKLNEQTGVFLATLLNKNKYKYNYGRVVGIQRLKVETLKLPVDENGNPDWQLMEDYINSLPYSKYL